MTGYGYAEKAHPVFSLSVEIKSYNNRYLEIICNLPPLLSRYEAEISTSISKKAARGRVEVLVKVKTLKSDLQVEVDKEVVERLTEAFAQVSIFSGKALKPALSDYLNQEGVLVSVSELNSELYREDLFAALDEALSQFSASKVREGKATALHLTELGKEIGAGLAVIEANADRLEEHIKQNLLRRFHELLGDQQYDENRIIQEVAVMLVRYSAAEEISRLGIHLQEYYSLLQAKEPVGKRLDFLCQEMNREINTIGSKSQLVEMNLEVVKMKNSLENIREQVRNIE
jgi:uncharacterized protein (TIGR00255 family)